MALRSPSAQFLGFMCIICIFQRLVDFNFDAKIEGAVSSSSSSGGNCHRAATATSNHHNIKPHSYAHIGDSYIDENTFPFDHGNAARNSTHLIIVAGHSALISHHLQDVGEDEEDWFLLDYQIGQGLPQVIKSHITAALEEAQSDPHGLVIFSGGPTRSLVGPEAEGPSYFQAADAMKLWPQDSNVRTRTTTEEFALDSFQNLLFSICRFKEITGSYPKHITMVSFTSKRRRFEEVHAPALRWPPGKFSFIGVDPPSSTGFDLKKASQGELQNSLKPFEEDPYGCGAFLQDKRLGRNPFYRTAPYPLSCPDLRPLLEWCGPEIVPFDMVPWLENHGIPAGRKDEVQIEGD